MSTASNYSQPGSIVGVLYNWGKHNAYSVPGKDRDKHETCVYFALDNMQVGESCDWYSNKSNGVVQVVAHRPQGSGWCTVLFNSVDYKGQTKNWKDVACKTGGRSDWKFASR